MNKNADIHYLIKLKRKALIILLAVMVGISFSAGGVMAGNCLGGIDCLMCAAESHSHNSADKLNSADFGCQPVGQSGSCGFEVSHRPDKFDRIASTIGFGDYQHAGIFSAAADSSDPIYYLLRLVILPFQYPILSELTPVYLLNQSLLC